MLGRTRYRVRAGSCLVAVRSCAATFVSLLACAGNALALPIPQNCQVDPRGANDRPGQRDVSMFCVERRNEPPWEMTAAVSFDAIHLTGANTMDSCLLLNTDGDAFANFAVCITLQSSGSASGNLSALKHIRLFSCDDTKAGKCMGATQVSGPHGTACELSHPDSDPFSPAAPGGPGDDYPYDARVVCAVDLDDFDVPASDIRLLDTCSFPSALPNSDPDDCILLSGCASADDCEDGNDCTRDECDSSGVCMFLADATANCTDGLFCTRADLCNPPGFCENAGAPLSCDDGIACTIDDCDEFSDACLNDPRSSLCDDGQFCNGVETCDATEGCLVGTAPACTDSIACTVDICDEAMDLCVHAPAHALCDDNTWCNGSETCDAEAGCVAGSAPACADSVECTIDRCDEDIDACTHSPNPAVCDDGVYCNGAEDCRTDIGCAAGTPPVCDDGVACTADFCLESADRCMHEPGNEACQDGIHCNGVEVCDELAGCKPGSDPCPGPAACDETGDRCVGCATDAECDNGIHCDGAETCDRTTASCMRGVAVHCDDGVGCTLDACDEAANSCTHAPADALCDNQLYCDGTETCDPARGCLPGAEIPCEDDVACTTDSCIEATDRCAHVADDTRCDNGRFCDGEEFCDAAAGCESGEPVTCRPDRYACSTSECDIRTDRCEVDFSRCVCGDHEQIPGEECEAPRRAGSFEDCNNAIDDDGDGAADCIDLDCASGSDRGVVCDENCQLDRLCAPVAKDPAVISFRENDSDSLWIHGRFAIEHVPDPMAEGFEIEISNGVQPIYVARLGVGDLEGNASDLNRYSFTDPDARWLGNASARGGLAKVNVTLRMVDGVEHIAFRVRAYGDFSAATRRSMSTQIRIGRAVGTLTENWQAARRRWILRQRDF